MKRSILILLTLIYPVFLFSQILNLDRTVEADPSDTTKKKFAAVLGASFTSYQQKYSFVDEALNFDLTYYMPKDHILVLSGKSDFTSTGGDVIQNLGYIHLRYRDNDTRIVSLEPFTQYQWNITLGLIQRYLAGCNLRIQLINNAKEDVYYGVGVMYENEKWNYNGVTNPDLIPPNAPIINNDFYKTNQYIKGSFSINANCDIVDAVFLQNKISDFLNAYRLSDYLTFNIRISKKFFFSVSADIAYDNKPVVPITNPIYTFVSTISIKL